MKEKVVDFSRETLEVGLSGSDIAEARRLGKKKAAIGDAEKAGRTPPVRHAPYSSNGPYSPNSAPAKCRKVVSIKSYAATRGRPRTHHTAG